MATNTKIKTTFSTTAVSRFEKNAREGEQLGCEYISGFSLFKKREASTKTLKSGEKKQIRAHVVYRMRYTDSAGKRRVVKIGSTNELHPQQAAEIAIQWRTGLVKGEADPMAKREELAKQKRIQEQEEAHSQYKQTGRFFEDVYRPHLLENYRTGHEVANKIKSFAFLFERDMDKVTAQDINTWYSKKTKEGLKRQSAMGYLGAFKAMLNFAAGTKKGDQNDNPVIEYSPLRDYSLPRPTKVERSQQEAHDKRLQAKRDIFSNEVRRGIMTGLEGYAEHIRAMRRRSRKHGKAHLPDLDQVTYPHWFIPFAHIARLTGMRPSDIGALRWEQLDHNRFNGRTTLEFTPQKTKDKGEKPVKVRFPVDGELLAVFEAWREQNGKPSSGFMFKSERTGGQLERKAYLKHWAHVVDIGKLPEDLDFYSFRHNFISSLVRRNVALIKIARLVGHANTDMIVKYYLREDEEDMMDVAALAAETWTEQPKAKAGNEL